LPFFAKNQAMQSISPRKYFETRLRKLPIYKCRVNEDWQREKMAQVVVLRKHVNGNISGANFLVDLLCLGVKDVTWFFNTDAGEMEEMLHESGLGWEDVPYALAHNIVYAGLEFAEEFHIKPHPDFTIAKYALEEDDDNIELIDIDTGEDGIPHLIERHPGQYADAHSKLKKYAGPGNFKVSVAFETEEEADETEESWANESQWDDEDEDEDNGEIPITLEEIELGMLTISDAALLTYEELHDDHLFETRDEMEQQKIYAERMARLYESYLEEPGFITDVLKMPESAIEEVDSILQLTEEDLELAITFPLGCNEDTYEKGMSDFFELMDGFPESSLTQKMDGLSRLLEKTNPGNPIPVSNCLLYLLIVPDGESLLQPIQPFLNEMRDLPLVALSQTFLVTAAPSIFSDPPLVTSQSPLLREVFPGYAAFSHDEYALFYALRCLQAAQQKHIPLMSMWYRLLIDTEEADIRMPMLAGLYKEMMPVWMEFLKRVMEEEG
jgi:hypothetical protein